MKWLMKLFGAKIEKNGWSPGCRQEQWEQTKKIADQQIERSERAIKAAAWEDLFPRKTSRDAS